jgi:hypothetical protein
MTPSPQRAIYIKTTPVWLQRVYNFMVKNRLVWECFTRTRITHSILSSGIQGCLYPEESSSDRKRWALDSTS